MALSMVSTMLSFWLRDEEGQDTVEYALLVVTIAFFILVGTTGFGQQLKAAFAQMAETVRLGLAGG